MQAPANVDDTSGERVSVRSPLIGSVVAGRYRVLALIGAGGMAEVYEVEHVELGRRFALKALRPELCENASVVGRFEREARSVSKLISDHIAAIVDAGVTESGVPYFVMERLYGQELRRTLEQDGPLGARRALYLARDVCRALEVAHAAGIIHRDLKPENLFVVPGASGAERCKVLDFGVAKLSQENPTLPGTLVGTARYMAPEQIAGPSEQLGPATDVFALGVILFECFAGRPPFEADSLERLLFRIVNEPAPSLQALRPELPASVVQLVESMLQKDPAARPPSAGELSRIMEALAGAGEGTSTLSTDATLAVPFVLAKPRPAATAASVAWRALALLAVLGAGVAMGLRLGAGRDSTETVAPTSVSSEARPSAPQPSSIGAEPPPKPAVSAPQLPRAAPTAPKAPGARPTPSAAPSAPAGQPNPPLFFPSDAP